MIGQLRTRLGLYVPEIKPDQSGGHTTRWVQYGQVWANIRPTTSRERGVQGRAAITLNYRVIIRWQANFPERVRLLWGERTLRVITASDPDGRKERLHLICEEEQQ